MSQQKHNISLPLWAQALVTVFFEKFDEEGGMTGYLDGPMVYARRSVEKFKEGAGRGGSIDGQVHVHRVRVEPLEEIELC